MLLAKLSSRGELRQRVSNRYATPLICDYCTDPRLSGNGPIDSFSAIPAAGILRELNPRKL
jgi:hypothetical protein